MLLYFCCTICCGYVWFADSDTASSGLVKPCGCKRSCCVVFSFAYFLSWLCLLVQQPIAGLERLYVRQQYFMLRHHLQHRCSIYLASVATRVPTPALVRGGGIPIGTIDNTRYHNPWTNFQSSITLQSRKSDGTENGDIASISSRSSENASIEFCTLFLVE